MYVIVELVHIQKQDKRTSKIRKKKIQSCKPTITHNSSINCSSTLFYVRHKLISISFTYVMSIAIEPTYYLFNDFVNPHIVIFSPILCWSQIWVIVSTFLFGVICKNYSKSPLSYVVFCLITKYVIEILELAKQFGTYWGMSLFAMLTLIVSCPCLSTISSCTNCSFEGELGSLIHVGLYKDTKSSSNTLVYLCREKSIIDEGNWVDNFFLSNQRPNVNIENKERRVLWQNLRMHIVAQCILNWIKEQRTKMKCIECYKRD